jgi:hypothetical protein
VRLRSWIQKRLERFLTEPIDHYERRGANDFDALKRLVRKGDVLLVEGDQRVSAIIKTLTQSCWSHAALYIGDELLQADDGLRRRMRESFGGEAEHLVVEALVGGVVVSPITKYIDYNVRLCRPHQLTNEHRKRLIEEAVASIGWRYDVHNIIDLFGHLIRVSLLPRRYRRDALRLGSGSATSVICTSLLGRLFQDVGFPVLPSMSEPHSQIAPPRLARRPLHDLLLRRRARRAGIYRRRHPTLLLPRDFDLSPFFEIVKFNVIGNRDFDYQQIEWADDEVA